MSKGGLIVSKKEMTKFWSGDKFVPVTLVDLVPQEIVRYKNSDKDGYVAVVVGAGKKELKKEKGNKLSYKKLTEFKVDEDFVKNNEVGKVLDLSFLQGIESVQISGYTKGKGFQGAMKRCNVHGGPKTHGSKFHRTVGSMGNRKPRRTLKGHPHAGHMGDELVTLKNKKIFDIIQRDGENLIAIGGSLPGGYNGYLKLCLA